MIDKWAEFRKECAVTNMWDFCNDLRAVLKRNAELELENMELRECREKYEKLLNSSVRHGETVMASLLVATLNGNIGQKPVV